MSIYCRLGFHKWGLMHAYRLAPSVVYRVCCERCGKEKGT